MKSPLDLVLEIEDPLFRDNEVAANPSPAPPLPVLSARTILQTDTPPREDILGDALLFPKALTSLIAPPGTGKTRFAIQVASASLAGAPLGPLAVPRRALRWAILAGNENSLLRYKTDLSAMLRAYPDAVDAILDNIFFHVIEDMNDFMAPDSGERIKATIRAVEADVAVIDPLGDLITGDANADVDMRATLHNIARAVWGASPNAAIWIIHHARDGRLNIGQAVGWDKGNYGKGSKALRAASRASINLAPMDKDSSGNIVVACGKCNDAREFEAFGLKFENGVYVEHPGFDLDAWVADVEGKRTQAKCSIQDIVDYVAPRPETGASLAELAEHIGVEKMTVWRHVEKGVKGRFLRTKVTGKMKWVFSTGKIPPRSAVNDDTNSTEEASYEA